MRAFILAAEKILEFIAKTPALKGAAARYLSPLVRGINESNVVVAARTWMAGNPTKALLLLSALMELPGIAKMISDMDLDWSDSDGAAPGIAERVASRLKSLEASGLSTSTLRAVGDNDPGKIAGRDPDDGVPISQQKRIFDMIDRASAVAGSYRNFLLLRDAILAIEEEHIAMYETFRS